MKPAPQPLRKGTHVRIVRNDEPLSGATGTVARVANGVVEVVLDRPASWRGLRITSFVDHQEYVEAIKR